MEAGAGKIVFPNQDPPSSGIQTAVLMSSGEGIKHMGFKIPASRAVLSL
jgi:hypothetical protein